MAASLLFSVNVASGMEAVLRFQGKAYSLETDELLYSEHHRVSLDDQGRYDKGTVEYFRPDGERFAVKNINYQRNQSAPYIFFRDLRSDSAVKIDATAAELSILSSDRFSEHVKGSDTGKLSIVPVSTDLPLVVDAGFDRFVQQNWSSLVRGESLVFSFLVISRARLVDFEIFQSNEKNNESTHFLAFVVKPKNFFFSLLVEPIRLTYDSTTRRLLRFEGLTNIEKFSSGHASGDNFVARIQYEYF